MQTLIAPLLHTLPRGTHHQRHPVERGIVIAERTQRVRDPHKALRVPAGIEQQIEPVQRTLELLVELDGSVRGEVVPSLYDPRGTT